MAKKRASGKAAKAAGSGKTSTAAKKPTAASTSKVAAKPKAASKSKAAAKSKITASPKVAAKSKVAATSKVPAKPKVAAKPKATPASTGKAGKASKVTATSRPARLAELLAAGEGFQLGDRPTDATPGFHGGKAEGIAALAEGAQRLTELQTRLAAGATGGSPAAALLVVQGMDTSGKGGIVQHVVGACNPEGVRVTSYKVPTAEERAHDFLWRIRQALPPAGKVGVFDRSHYEDVLVVRVHDLVPRATWARRYSTINRFEQSLTDRGTTVIKVMLHLSYDEQRRRLEDRLDRPDKWWKYKPGDIDEREFWPAYQEAYQAAIERCSTEAAPWYVVPADKKWYARWAVQQLLLDHLEKLDLQWPAADFDVDAEKARLAAT